MSGRCEVPLDKVPFTDNVEKFIETQIPKDMKDTVRWTGIHENEEQIALGNKPREILVDESSSKRMAAADVSINVKYNDPGPMADAISEAISTIKSITPVLSGAARASYKLFLNESELPDVAGDSGSIKRIAESMGQKDYLAIMGPTVEYGRKVYWRPIIGARNAGVRMKQDVEQRYGTKDAGITAVPGHKKEGKRTRQDAIMPYSLDIVAPRYPSLSMAVFFRETGYLQASGKDARTPGFMIRYRAAPSKR